MKKFLLLTAAAMTASVAVNAQIASVKKVDKADLSLTASKMSPIVAKRTQVELMKKQEAGTAKMVDWKKSSKSVVSTRDAESDAEPYYLTPAATFYSAGTPDNKIYSYLYMPAYADVKYMNISDTEAEWSYQDIMEDDATTSSVDLVTAYMHGMGDQDAPIMTVGENSYQKMAVSAELPYSTLRGWDFKALGIESDMSLADQFLTNAEIDYGYFTVYTNLDAGSSKWLEYMNDDYGSLLGTITSANVTSFCNQIPQPASPYVLRSVTMHIAYEASEAISLTMKLYIPGEDGYMDSLLTSVDFTVPAQSLGYAPVTVPVRVKDAVTGLIRNSATVSTPLLVELTGFADNESISDFRMCTIAHEKEYALKDYPFYGVAKVTVELENGQKGTISESMPHWGYYMDESMTSVEYPSQFYMDYDLYYPFLGLYDMDEGVFVNENNIEIALPQEGGEKTFQVFAYDLSTEEDADIADWVIIGDDEDEEVPSWLNVVLGTEGEGDDAYECVSFVAEELEEGAPARKAVVTIEETGGGSRTFIVSQGEGDGAGNGISSVSAVAGEAGVAAVYTLEGKRVASTDDLAKGVYIVKKNDGSAVKVVKK